VQILLFLSAMLAGFTGLISGDRAVEPRHVEQAIAAVSGIAESSSATVAKAEVAVAAAMPARSAPAATSTFAPAPAEAPRGLAPVDERRLE